MEFANLKPGNTVIDLGAYCGLTSILFKEVVGDDGTVIALDADKQNIKACKDNFALYKKLTGREIVLIEGAIWSHCKGLSFSAEGNMGSAACEIVGSTRGAIVDVNSYTLTRLMEISGMQKVDFIKCDVEGAEACIFEDVEFFQNFRPRLIIEPHFMDGILTLEKCKGDLLNHGYACETTPQHGVAFPLLQCAPIVA
jgi:FkbM family methyltransferase